jgi:hypothetical protein
VRAEQTCARAWPQRASARPRSTPALRLLYPTIPLPIPAWRLLRKRPGRSGPAVSPSPSSSPQCRRRPLYASGTGRATSTAARTSRASTCVVQGVPPRQGCRPGCADRRRPGRRAADPDPVEVWKLRIEADRFCRCGISHFRPVRADHGPIGSALRCLRNTPRLRLMK